MVPYQTICDLVGHSASRILEYNVVHAVINKYIIDGTLRTRNFKDLRNTPTFRNKKVEKAKHFREILLSALKPIPCAQNFWKHKLNYELKKPDWSMSFNTTSESRLRVLQWKILHNIYPTNILLCKMKVTETNFCCFCPDTIDFIEHFFFSCPIIRNFWKHMELFILAKIGMHIHLSMINVLFGVQNKTE